MATLLHAAAGPRQSLRELLPELQWQSLPPGTRRRFGGIFQAGVTRCYVGEVTAAHLSPAGRMLAQLCRLVGAPLPLFATAGPAVVTVTDHQGNGGQVWARCYHRRRGFAQCVQSVKRFEGPTGLEEYLGCGLAMPLTVEVDGGTLTFRSAGYQLVIGRRRIDLPRWLHPGYLTVRHRELCGDTFTFEMVLHHPRFGRLVHQHARFIEAGPAGTVHEVSTARISGEPAGVRPTNQSGS